MSYFQGVTVTFEKPIHDEAIEGVMEAIRHMRGVLKVEPVICTSDSYFAEERALQELRDKIRELLWPKRA